MASIVERDGGLMDALTLVNGIGKFVNGREQRQAFATGVVGSIGDVHKLLCQTITNPERTVLTTRHLEKSRTWFQQTSRQVATIYHALPRRTDTGGIGGTTRSLVSFVARVNDLFGRFFQNEFALVVYGIGFCAKTSGANVVS
jgi:hypothetical protein